MSPTSEWQEPESKKILDVPSIATLATERSDIIQLKNIEMLVITAQVTYESGADVSTQVKVKFSPKGGLMDTIDYTSFYLTYTANAKVKRSVPVDVAPFGILQVHLYNGDDQAIGRARVWYTAQRRKLNPDNPRPKNPRYAELPEYCYCHTPDCGYILSSPSMHCKEYTCPKCGATLWRAKP